MNLRIFLLYKIMLGILFHYQPAGINKKAQDID